MLSWLIGVAAAATTLPTPVEAKGSPASWVRASDLPEFDRQAAVTTFDLIIDSSGNPIACNIVVPSGSGKMDSAICEALLKRARFKPSSDADGSNTASIYRDRVVWLPSAGESNYWVKAPDIVISTPQLTDKLKQVAEVLIVTEGNGGPPTCMVSISVGHPNLDKRACSVAADPKVSPPIKVLGVQVHGVRLLRIGFTPGPVERVIIR